MTTLGDEQQVPLQDQPPNGPSTSSTTEPTTTTTQAASTEPTSTTVTMEILQQMMNSIKIMENKQEERQRQHDDQQRKRDELQQQLTADIRQEIEDLRTAQTTPPHPVEPTPPTDASAPKVSFSPDTYDPTSNMSFDSTSDWWSSHWNTWEWEDSGNSWKQPTASSRGLPFDNSKPSIQHLHFPTYDGDVATFSAWKYAAKNLKLQCDTRDHVYLVPKLLSALTGKLKLDFQRQEFNPESYMTLDGVERFITYVRKRLGITELQQETDAFERFFHKMGRNKGESFVHYINEEETAYRKLQTTMDDIIAAGEDEFSEDEADHIGSSKQRFRLPKRLRGWLFLTRSGLRKEDYPTILSNTGGMNYDKLRRTLLESYGEDVLRVYDKKHSSTYYNDDEEWATWNNNWTQPPASSAPTSDWNDYNYFDDPDSYYDEDYFDEDYEDPSRAGYIDEHQQFNATQEVIDECDHQLGIDDPEYSALVVKYAEARDCLTKARVARGFFPVVVPASSSYFGKPPGRGKGKRKPKGKSKGRSKGSGKRKSKGKSKGKSYGNATSETPGPSSSSTRPSGKGNSPGPICFRCGKRGHISSECTNEPLTKRTRDSTAWTEGNSWDQDESWDWNYVVLEMHPSHHDDSEWEKFYRARDGPFVDGSSESKDKAYKKFNNSNDFVVNPYIDGEYRGCGLLDTGCSTEMHISRELADTLQADRKQQGDPDVQAMRSDGIHHYGGGASAKADWKIRMEIPAGQLKGKEIVADVVDTPSSRAPPLIGMRFMRKNKMVLDTETGSVMFKDDPQQRWHKCPTRGGAMFVPLTREAQVKHISCEFAECLANYGHSDYNDNDNTDIIGQPPACSNHSVSPVSPDTEALCHQCSPLLDE